MKRTPAALPNIEDATFAECLAPLADGPIATVGGESFLSAGHAPAGVTASPAAGPRRRGPFDLAEPVYPGSPHGLPLTEPGGESCLLPHDIGVSATPQALAEWRSLADREFAEFCAIAQFLAKTDAELVAAVRDYPRQVRGFLDRLERTESRRALQQQAMIEVIARIEYAMLQADIDAGAGLPLAAGMLDEPPFSDPR